MKPRTTGLTEYAIVVAIAAALVVALASKVYAAVAPLLSGMSRVLEGAAR